MKPEKPTPDSPLHNLGYLDKNLPGYHSATNDEDRPKKYKTRATRDRSRLSSQMSDLEVVSDSPRKEPPRQPRLKDVERINTANQDESMDHIVMQQQKKDELKFYQDTILATNRMTGGG